MSEEYGNDFIVLTDEEGRELELEHLDTVEYNGRTYMAFIPAESSLDESCELIIMKTEEDPENGEEMLVTLDDEDELNDLFQVFSERLDDGFEEEEGQEAELKKEGY